LAGLNPSLGDAWTPLAKGSHRNLTGKLAETAQLALEDEQIEDMISIDVAAVLSDDYEDVIHYPKSYSASC
jgi:hypothetical protein